MRICRGLHPCREAGKEMSGGVSREIETMSCNVTLCSGATCVLRARLLDGHRLDFLERGQAKQDLLNSILHKGGHTLFNGSL